MAVAEASPEWAIGFEDDCRWSWLALPTLSSWAEQGKPMRLVQQSVAKDDPEPKAISCYELYVPQLDERWPRFVEERPVSSIRAHAPSNKEFIVPDYCVLHGVAHIRTVGTWTNLTRLTFDCTEFLHGREWCQSGVNRAYSYTGG
jgi:hypothetical protein